MTQQTKQDFSTTIVVDQTPEQAFAAIANVRGWWMGEHEGAAGELGAKLTYRYKDMHRSTHEVTEAIPGKRLVWKVIDSRLEFIQDKSEWTGTAIIFDISRKGDKTEVVFTHAGLNPSHECYDACSRTWSSLVGDKLRQLIANG